MEIVITDHAHSSCPMSPLLFVSTYECVELSPNCALGCNVDLMLENEEGEAECLRRPGPQLESYQLRILVPRSVLLTASLFFPVLALWSLIDADISLII